MNPREYEILAEVEEYHWWYRAQRSVITACLETPRFALPESPKILEAGCGTGGNLKSMAELTNPSWLGGLDASEQGLELARTKAPDADLYLSDICDPEIRMDELDLVISTDVIYIPGVERALPGLRKITSALRPGGIFILNVPAYNWLFSEHDVAVHTSERYTTRRVGALLRALDLKIELLSYRLCFLFPAVVAARLPSMFGSREKDLAARSDFRFQVSHQVNEALFRVMSLESPLIARGHKLPFGSSVFAIGRRL